MSDHRDPTLDPTEELPDTAEVGLDALIGDACQLAERDMIYDDVEAPPFAAVVARAHLLDPVAVPREWAEGFAHELPPMPDNEGDRHDPLARFIHAARAHAEAEVREHLRTAPPEQHVAAATRRAATPKRRSYRGVAALAAAAALAVIVPSALQGPDRAQREHGERGLFQSVIDRTLGGGDERTARTVEPEPEHATHSARPAARVAPTAPEDDTADLCGDEDLLECVVDELPPVPEERIAAEPEDVDDVEEIEEPTPARPSRRERLRALDDAAEDALKGGDLDKADELYRDLIRRGGNTPLVERAYGDLFTIARRRGDAAARQELWRDYLKRFPRGRFAEDAHAGLCRLRPATERSACWNDYLEQFPNGTYAALARRALDSADVDSP